MDETVSAEALRESEELHRITLLNMSDAVFITNDEGVFTFICPNVDVIFGYSHGEVQAMQRISRLLGCELIEPGQLGDGGEVRNIEHEVECKGGARRVLLVHVKRVAIRRGTILYVCRDVTERKQSEQELRRHDERLKLALEAASMGTWDWDVPSGEMTWSPETHRMFGDPAVRHTPSFPTFLERVHTDDRARVARTMSEAMDRGAVYETEFRLLGYDAGERWIMAMGKALRNGKPLRMLGVFVDLTERHRVDADLRELGGRLINAHEQERMRLSRELHDNVGQLVALLSVELELLRQQLRTSAPPVHAQFAKLFAHASELGSDLHRLSHELHPARLEHLGLEESIRSVCEEFAGARQIALHLEISDVSAGLDRDAVLCLYRIAQESLHNVVKHSGATRVEITLAAAPGEVVLRVADDGVGFDPRSAQQKDTLGLVSMRERARLVRGQLTVSSKPGDGTKIEVRLPTTGPGSMSNRVIG